MRKRTVGGSLAKVRRMPAKVSRPSKPTCQASTTSAVGEPTSKARAPAGAVGGGAEDRQAAGRARVAGLDLGEHPLTLGLRGPSAFREDDSDVERTHRRGEVAERIELDGAVGRIPVEEVVGETVADDVETRFDSSSRFST